jgi:hypothetical protein
MSLTIQIDRESNSIGLGQIDFIKKHIKLRRLFLTQYSGVSVMLEKSTITETSSFLMAMQVTLNSAVVYTLRDLGPSCSGRRYGAQ